MISIICKIFGHNPSVTVDYPMEIHPLPRETVWCIRCSTTLHEESFERARERAQKAFQVLMAEDDRD
jgi:hypothetical protein